MRYPRRKLPFLPQLHQNLSLLFPFFKKSNFLPDFLCPAAEICLNSLLAVLHPYRRIVEIRNGLMKGIRRILRQHFLKMAKSSGTFVKILWCLCLFTTYGTFHQDAGTPPASSLIHIVRFSIGKRLKMQCLPFWISSFFLDLLFQVCRHLDNVLHKFFRLLKNGCINLLQDLFFLLSLFPFGSHQKGIIDVPVSISPDFRKGFLP